MWLTGLSVITARPSSSTNSAFTPRAFSAAAAARAPVPRTSSSSPLTRMMLRFGLKPWAARLSSASNRVISVPLSSTAPRPQTAPSAISPEKGGCFQLPSVPGVTGTTSWWAIRMMGARLGSEPAQV